MPRGVACLLLSLGLSGAGLAVELYPHPALPMWQEPYGLIAVDLNDDGHADLISANRDTDDVAILYGHGDGTFAPVKRYEACGPGLDGGASFARLGDFDEDGIDDLAVACSFSGEISILLAQADGSFGPPVEYGVVDELPVDLAVGDFDGDDHLDIVAANWANGGSSTVYWGAGDGTFGDEIEVDHNPCWSIAAGDFNGDGIDDFARGRYGSGLRVRLAKPNRTFADPADYGIGGRHVRAVDLNGDDVLDLVSTYGDSDGAVTILLGHADGTFTEGQTLETGRPNATFTGIADFDGDGNLDLATSNYLGSPGLSLYFGDGTGQFGAALELDFIRERAYSIAIADFNEDGFADLARPSFTLDEINILFGRGEGRFATGLLLEIGDEPQDVVVADLDSDGRNDLVSVNLASDDVSILFGSAAAEFAPEIRVPVGDEPSAIAVAQLDGDPAPDLVVANAATNDLTLLINDGAGSFTAGAGVAVGAAPSAVVAADLDGDGQDDVAVTHATGNDLSVRLGLGDGTLGPALTIPTGLSPTAIAAGDLDGDDVPDLAVANRDSDDVTLLLGVGDGTFVSLSAVPVGEDPTDLKLADLTGDGVRDLAVVHETSSDLHVYPGDGSGGMGAALVLPLNRAWPSGPFAQSLVTSDLDGDGSVDMAVGSSRWIGVWLADGEGGFGPERDFVADYGILGLAAADLNEDGRVDLAGTASSGALSLLLNQSGPTSLVVEADRETVTWPAVTGALSYEVYRGDLSSLVDVDDDGLPDDGYGSCLTGLDPDPTDTVFLDPVIPTTGDGLFYLRSVVDAEGETGLGTTSTGLARQPGVPCP
ncbi:MAG: VCBS repeat-containing protein [bacterium]|nr:VCBS repeat-containing protein [bacterium]